MKTSKKVLKAIGIVIILVIMVLGGIILYAVFSDYKPAERVLISATESPSAIDDTVEITALIWNIGYCGMDKDMDFFYDGGTKVFTPKERCIENLLEVIKFLKKNDTIDFILLQEVDVKSKRSYQVNEYKTVSEHLKTHTPYFAPNYDVFFVPVPPASPMGKVFSGISTLSRHESSSAVRFAFPGEYGFPKQLFMLDRCFLVNRYPLINGKEMILINTHNEAFDPGQIRKEQMEYLKNFMTGEYEKGNYVIAGGDWNQCPPDFKHSFRKDKVNTGQMVINSDYLPAAWNWAFDGTEPSNRTVIEPYEQGVTTATVIDFFLLSPNVEKISVKCINLNFNNSDHNPVILKAKLK